MFKNCNFISIVPVDVVVVVGFVDSHVPCWARNCHWCCLSQELLISKALCYIDEQLIILAPGQYFIFIFLFVSYFISVPYSGLLNPFESLCLDIRETHMLSPHSHWSCFWVLPEWLKKMLTQDSQVEVLWQAARVLPTLFTFVLLGTLIVVPGSYWQYVFNHGWM